MKIIKYLWLEEKHIGAGARTLEWISSKGPKLLWWVKDKGSLCNFPKQQEEHLLEFILLENKIVEID